MPLEDAVALALSVQPSAVPGIASGRDQGGRHAGLTARELEVLELVARGLTNAEIAGAP